jgi:hypothetical protein
MQSKGGGKHGERETQRSSRFGIAWLDIASKIAGRVFQITEVLLHLLEEVG